MNSSLVVPLRFCWNSGAVLKTTFQLHPCFCKKADSSQRWFTPPDASVMLPSQAVSAKERKSISG
jgi:hypothetical protein